MTREVFLFLKRDNMQVANHLVRLIFLCTFCSAAASHAGGNVETMTLQGTKFRAAGWACDSTRPNEATGIHIWRESAWLTGGNASIPREPAVGTACGSSNSNHGFDISVDVPEALLDNADHVVTVYSVGSGGYTEAIGSKRLPFLSGKLKLPKTMGDIVGRDLDTAVAGALGHIGIWDGTQVIEVLNEPGNVVKINTWENFRGRTKPWDTAYPKIPNYSVRTCYAAVCNGEGAVFGGSGGSNPTHTTFDSRLALIRRAFQIMAIGASYTLTAAPTVALPTINRPSGQTGARKGVYRCDTFVLDLFAWIDIPTGSSENVMWSRINPSPLPFNRSITNAPVDWKNKMRTLFLGDFLPVSIYNKMKSFE